MKPTSVAVDQTTSDVYVTDPGHFRIEKFTSSGEFILMFGKEVNRSEVDTPGSTEAQRNVCTAASGDICQPGAQGSEPGAFSDPAFIAVDNSSDASRGDIYVGDTGDNYVSKFESSGNLIPTWSSGGHSDGSNSSDGPFDSIYGIAVDSAGRLLVYDDKNTHSSCSGCMFEFDQNGNIVSEFSTNQQTSPIGIAVDSSDRIYTAHAGIGGEAHGVDVFSEGGAELGEFATEEGRGIAPTGIAVAASGAVYVDDGSVIRRYAPTCVPDGTYVCRESEVIGSGHLSSAAGLAVNSSGTVFSANTDAGNIASFSLEQLPDPATDNPAVLDAVSSAGARKTGDFQVTPNGDFAAFTSTRPLTESVDNAGYSEVYRYDATTDTLACVSCDPTGATAAGNASLASNGLSLTEDGSVFFNSTDSLVPRDLDNRQDVYEWEPAGLGNCTETNQAFDRASGGCLGLISTGTSPSDSSLLSVSADGTDAYFFTRDSLVPQDQNGNLVKIYDARELGGYPYIPTPPQCKASDECHGPGSPIPAAPDIQSDTPGGLANATPLQKAKHGHRKGTHHRPRKRRSSLHGHGGRR